MKSYLAAAAMLLPTAAAHAAEPQSTSEAMSFDQCLATIRATAAQLGITPISIVETNEMRMVRFAQRTPRLVTCSRPDHKRVLTVSPHRCE